MKRILMVAGVTVRRLRELALRFSESGNRRFSEFLSGLKEAPSDRLHNWHRHVPRGRSAVMKRKSTMS